MARLDQTRAPFHDGLAQIPRRQATMFSTPGHKRGAGASDEARAMFGSALEVDVPHGGGADTTHLSYGLLRQAEALAADAGGADDARYLVNGSTTGNLAMLLATCATGDEVLISRMLHKSLLAALVFSGARPVWLTPEIDSGHNLPLETSVENVAAALESHPRAKAVVLVSPSYVGVTSDLAAIGACCRQHGVPLLVDEAWGPHFHYHPELPASAMQSGADASVSSTHKMLAALTQGSTLLMRRGLLDLDRLQTIVDMVQTTSPSALIFTSLDLNRRQMALEGRDRLTATLGHARRLRSALDRIDGLQVLSPTLVAGRPGVGFDETRVMVDVHGLGLTGYQAEQILRDEYAVYVEMSDLLSVLLLITIGDTDASIDQALAGFAGLAGRRREARHSVAVRSSGALLFSGSAELTPREAFMAPSVAVPVSQAVGRISAESITPYPPGIPIVVAGERVSQEVLDYLQSGITEGMYISGLADAAFQTVRVVA
jgi:arginine/lysine/ornithine decarboxylase